LQLKDKAVIKEIGKSDPCTIRTKKDYFHSRKLARGATRQRFAAAFMPKECLVRMSDFPMQMSMPRCYLGARHLKPCGANPMIGFRGASLILTNALLTRCFRDGMAEAMNGSGCMGFYQ